MVDQKVIQELISKVELFLYISGPKMFYLLVYLYISILLHTLLLSFSENKP